jgi:CheY-like chemotaxis protein
MHMPGKDGVMLAAEIRRQFPHLNLPLILLSSLGSRDSVPDPALFAALLTKPAKPAQVAKVLAEVVNSRHSPAGGQSNASEAGVLPLASAGERVLLAEDNRNNQIVASLVLGRLGFVVDIAANGREALAALTAREYRLVLMDMQMPDMDGLEATRKARELTANWKMRPWIIALTANALEGDRQRCLDAGMDDYLAKPYKPAQLAEAIARARNHTQQPALDSAPGRESVF